MFVGHDDDGDDDDDDDDDDERKKIYLKDDHHGPGAATQNLALSEPPGLVGKFLKTATVEGESKSGADADADVKQNSTQ